MRGITVLVALVLVVGCSPAADTVRSQRSPDGKYLAVVYEDRSDRGACLQCVDVLHAERMLPWSRPRCGADQPWFTCDLPVEIDWTGPGEVTAVGKSAIEQQPLTWPRASGVRLVVRPLATEAIPPGGAPDDCYADLEPLRPAWEDGRPERQAALWHALRLDEDSGQVLGGATVVPSFEHAFTVQVLRLDDGATQLRCVESDEPFGLAGMRLVGRPGAVRSVPLPADLAETFAAAWTAALARVRPAPPWCINAVIDGTEYDLWSNQKAGTTLAMAPKTTAGRMAYLADGLHAACALPPPERAPRLRELQATARVVIQAARH